MKSQRFATTVANIREDANKRAARFSNKHARETRRRLLGRTSVNPLANMRASQQVPRGSRQAWRRVTLELPARNQRNDLPICNHGASRDLRTAASSWGAKNNPTYKGPKNKFPFDHPRTGEREINATAYQQGIQGASRAPATPPSSCIAEPRPSETHV